MPFLSVNDLLVTRSVGTKPPVLTAAGVERYETNTATSAVARVERRIVASLRRMRCDVRTFDAEGCGRRSLLPQPSNSGRGDWFHQFGCTLGNLEQYSLSAISVLAERAVAALVPR